MITIGNNISIDAKCSSVSKVQLDELQKFIDKINDDLEILKEDSRKRSLLDKKISRMIEKTDITYLEVIKFKETLFKLEKKQKNLESSINENLYFLVNKLNSFSIKYEIIEGYIRNELKKERSRIIKTEISLNNLENHIYKIETDLNYLMNVMLNGNYEQVVSFVSIGLTNDKSNSGDFMGIYPWRLRIRLKQHSIFLKNKVLLITLHNHERFFVKR